MLHGWIIKFLTFYTLDYRWTFYKKTVWSWWLFSAMIWPPIYLHITLIDECIMHFGLAQQPETHSLITLTVIHKKYVLLLTIPLLDYTEKKWQCVMDCIKTSVSLLIMQIWIASNQHILVHATIPLPIHKWEQLMQMFHCKAKQDSHEINELKKKKTSIRH